MAVDWMNNWVVVGFCGFAAAVSVVVAAWVVTRLSSHRSAAKLRLDWYLPALRKARQDRFDTSGVVYSLFRKCLPGFAFSNRQTKSRGGIRRALRWLGQTWASTPLRRVCQALCLSAFLMLFCYACWPYDARPEASGWSSTGWKLAKLEQSTGHIFLDGGQQSFPKLEPNEQIWLVEPASAGQLERVVSPVRLVEQMGTTMVVNPADDTVLGTAAGPLIDKLLITSHSQWELHALQPNAWPRHYTANLKSKEFVPAEFFLAIDPLVSISTAIASRSWVWSLVSAGAILLVCVFIPRGFCGYICPLGTTIDLFDWAIGRRVTRLRVAGDGWWVHIKYYLLAATLLAAVFGVLVSGVFSAIPVITRASYMIIDPVQTGLLRGWHLIPPPNWGHCVSLLLFVGVLSLGFFRPRFWCKYVCPSGAVFSIFNVFRVTERKVESSCIHCNKCVEVCPFDAIKPDFTTRQSDCTLCQTCAGVCPTHAIKFVERDNVVELKVLDEPPTGETALGRRGFLSLAAGSGAAILGGAAASAATKQFGAKLGTDLPILPIRPPGSVPEQEFLEMCIRCGECFKVCPNNVLQVQGFAQGFEGLWTPFANPDWAGCESSCNACGQVCPTGAIRALPLEEKKHARMGLAVVNQSTCLPLDGVEDCDLCVVECQAAGYDAIEYQQVGTQVDEAGQPIEGTGFLAPVVIDEKCVGCGLCQTRCYAINVKQRHLLSGSAIVVETGEGKEDRQMDGSYLDLWNRRNGIQAADGKAKNGSQSFEPVERARSPSVESTPTEPPEDFGQDPFGSSEEFGDDPFGIN